MSIEKLFPYIEHNLVEYGSIFPNVNSILDHLFYVIGNGYDWHPDRGIPVHDSGKCIDEFPVFTDASWKKLIKKVKTKERGFHEQYLDNYKSMYESRPEKMQEHLLKFQRAQEAIRPVTVTAAQFTVPSLLAQISEDGYGNRIPLQRPYPICNYSAINYIDENTPKWFLRLALSSITAWHTYLVYELDTGSVNEKDHYQSSEFTWKTIQTLKELFSKLTVLNVPEPGDNVMIVKDDPNWRYSGCARPKIGMRGVIVPIDPMYAAETVGKVGVAFKETVLGYEESDKGDITLFLPAFQVGLV